MLEVAAFQIRNCQWHTQLREPFSEGRGFLRLRTGGEAVQIDKLDHHLSCINPSSLCIRGFASPKAVIEKRETPKKRSM